MRVSGEWAVVLAVSLCPRATGEGLHCVAVKGPLVEADAQQAASDIRLDAADAVEPQQLAADLLHAAAALGGTGEEQGEFEGTLGHGRPPAAVAASRATSASPERSSGPCSTCSRVMSSSTRMWASSGE